MDMINSKDPTEAEEIKKRWQEYTELYKKDLSLFSVPKKGNGISSQSQRRAMPKNVQAAVLLCSFHMLVRSCSKSFKQYVNQELPEVYKSQRNKRSNCQHLLDHQKRKRALEKHLLLL